MESAAHNLQALRHKRVLVVGDSMLDRYWFGSVDRISPEAPVPIVAVQQREERIGGAGNVAHNITALGGNATLLSMIGDDEAGQTLTKIATAAAINTELVTVSNMSTTVKLRLVAHNQQLLRADFETTPDQTHQATLLARFESLLKQHDIVVLSDYAKGCLNPTALINLAKQQGRRVLVDPKSDDYSAYAGADLVTPNLKEFQQATAVVERDEQIRQLGQRLIQQHHIKALLVTLSERGMLLLKANGDYLYKPASERKVYDVSGAGDTVIAVIALCVAANLPDAVALNLANCAAGIVVSKLGTATVTPAEMRAALARQ